jgi:hypothetical protein
MVRTQIQLTEEQHRQLKRWASRLGISLSEAVRRCVADRLAADRVELGREELVREALAVVGKYADSQGPSRMARDHDEHLAEAYRR